MGTGSGKEKYAQGWQNKIKRVAFIALRGKISVGVITTCEITRERKSEREKERKREREERETEEEREMVKAEKKFYK